MHTKPTDELMEKLAKILRLANDKAAQPGEAEAAIAKAKELALRYNLDLASVSLEDTSNGSNSIEVNRDDVGIRSKRFQIYHNYIFLVFEKCFGIKTILLTVWHNGWTSKVAMVGESSDVLICKMLLPWLEEQFYRTYHTYAKRNGLDPANRSNSAEKRGIYYGLYCGILAVNKQEEQKLSNEERGTMTMVLRRKEDIIQQRITEEFPNLKKGRQCGTSMNQQAYVHGKQEGRKVKLNQIGSSQHRQTIAQ